MKTLSLIIGAVLTLAPLTHAQTTIAQWTFETSVPGGAAGITGQSISGITPEVGTGSASGFHASASTTWSNPSGNGSVESFSGNNWGVGDYFEFQTSTVGFSGISVSFDQTSSGTGPRDFTLAYSTDGSNFTDFGSYSVLANAAPNPVWTTATYQSVYTLSFDLSPVSALNNSASVYFRIVDASTTSAGGGTVGTAGTDRLDNFTVGVVPEPSSVALLCLGAAGLLARRFRR